MSLAYCGEMDFGNKSNGDRAKSVTFGTVMLHVDEAEHIPGWERKGSAKKEKEKGEGKNMM